MTKRPTLQQSISETLQRMRHSLQDEAASLRTGDAPVISRNRDRIRLLELSVVETERALAELARRTEAAKEAERLKSDCSISSLNYEPKAKP